MKKLSHIIMLLLVVTAFASCRDSESYADQLKDERAAISKYIADSAVTVITEEQFAQQDYTTNLQKNEFVLISSSGVYMQIIRKGKGSKIADGETTDLLCRFYERNLMTDSLQLTNNILSFATMPDKMSVRNTSGTFTAAFDTNSSVMYRAYGSASVPSGWLTPLSYITPGREAVDPEGSSKVRLIVPAAQGQAYASQSVYPCLYDITYSRVR